MRAPAGHVLIAGGGIAGLSLGLALRRSLGERIAVTIADPDLARTVDDRAYAISAGSRRLLDALDIWPAIASAAQPITRMVITDSRTHDAVRPAYLTFDLDGVAGETDLADAMADEFKKDEPIAHMVEAAALHSSLQAACAAAGVVFLARAVSRFETGAASLSARLDDGTAVAATLLVAADGKGSRLRDSADLGWVSWSYGQSGIVATIAHARDHGSTARQHFLPAGPFAILPLTPLPDSAGGTLRHRSSIVWTEASADARALIGLDGQDFRAELERRSGLALGDLQVMTRPRAFPLRFGIARRFVGERIALIGDAAHVIHPIAGQGLNLGFRDVAALAQTLTEAVRSGLDIGTLATLKPYEQARRADTLLMGAATDALNRLFSNDLGPLRLLRDLGLGIVDRTGPLKRLFMRQAMGTGQESPLLRGQPL